MPVVAVTGRPGTISGRTDLDAIGSNAGSGSGGMRRIGRRPAPPSARAVIGGLLVAAAVLGTFAAWAGAGRAPGTRYVVAAADLPVGHLVAAGDLELVALDAPASLAAAAFTSTAAVVGQRTVAPLREGELVQRSAVVVPESAAAGAQVSVALDLSDALAGTLEEGELVDVVATYTGGDAPYSEVVAAGATVARLPGEGRSAGRVLVLLALAPGSDVLAVTTAASSGELRLVRPATDDTLAPGDRHELDGDGRDTVDGGADAATDG